MTSLTLLELYVVLVALVLVVLSVLCSRLIEIRKFRKREEIVTFWRSESER